jgi:hypothetical protein
MAVDGSADVSSAVMFENADETSAFPQTRSAKIVPD